MKAKSYSKPPRKAGGEARETYKDRNLMATNPKKEQFEPTPAEPVNQHKRMAGC